MYCSNCGKALEDAARYCSVCGTARSSVLSQPMEFRLPKPLNRIREGRRIAGVCGGIARYLDMDATLVRILWILITILPPVPGLIAYIICWIVMPQDPLTQASPPQPSSTASQVVDA